MSSLTSSVEIPHWSQAHLVLGHQRTQCMSFHSNLTLYHPIREPPNCDMNSPILSFWQCAQCDTWDVPLILFKTRTRLLSMYDLGDTINSKCVHSFASYCYHFSSVTSSSVCHKTVIRQRYSPELKIHFCKRNLIWFSVCFYKEVWGEEGSAP